MKYILFFETTNYGQHTNIFNKETWTSLWKYEYISGDGTGNSGVWTDLSTNIPANSIYSFDNFNAQGSYDLLVSVNPLDPNLVIIKILIYGVLLMDLHLQITLI